MSPSASRRSCAAGRPAAVEPASVLSFSSRRTPSLARSSRTKLFWASARGGAGKGRGDGRGAREGLEHLVFLVGFSPVG